MRVLVSTGQAGERWLPASWMLPGTKRTGLVSPGEQLLCEASTVLKCVQEDSCQRGVYGRLVCTDFKIAFLGDDESALDSDVCPRRLWLRGQCSRGPKVFVPGSPAPAPPARTTQRQGPAHHSALCPSGVPWGRPPGPPARASCMRACV